MANYVSVNIKFKTNKIVSAKIIKALKNHDGEIDFNVLIPMPFGIVNQRDWAIENWGTKFNCENVEIKETSIHFETPYNIPLSYIKKMSAIFPTVKIFCSWASEDIGSNVGYCELIDGQVLLIEEPDGDEAFWIKAARTVRKGSTRWRNSSLTSKKTVSS